MACTSPDPDFPCALTIIIPLPTHRLASSALRALSVDAELSPLVRRSFFLTANNCEHLGTPNNTVNEDGGAQPHGAVPVIAAPNNVDDSGKGTILRTEYRATTNRMLRVAVNGFMESVGVVLGVMEELDVDVIA